MIFFFGLRTSIIGRYLLHGVSCVYCGTLDSIYATIYSRYLHVFWIPILPLGKNSVSDCAHCQQILKPGHMPPAYRIPALTLEKQARTPISNYLVLALAGAAFVVLVLVGSLKNMGKP